MFGHLPEFFIVVVLALIVFGPEKFPEVAAQAGKMIREVRETMDTALNPHEVEVADDFDTYYYESLARSGDEEGPEMEVGHPYSEDEELVFAETHQTEALSTNGEVAPQEASGSSPVQDKKPDDGGPAPGVA
jgi:sec-independent protein translocase protein TatB